MYLSDKSFKTIYILFHLTFNQKGAFSLKTWEKDVTYAQGPTKTPEFGNWNEMQNSPNTTKMHP